MKRKRKLQLGLFIAIILLVLGGVLVVYLLAQQAADRTNLNDVTKVKELISRHYQLPIDEEPALATIDDKTKLNSDFLHAAENGDKLLIYKNAKKVILYRPSIDRIIEVGPVSIAPIGESGSS